VLLIVGYFAAQLMRNALVRAGRRASHIDVTVVTFFASIIKYAILGITFVAVLSNFGVQTNSVVAVIGAAGLAIGLALQGTLGHVASGFMLVLVRPFRVGDVIETAGVTGTVTELSLFTTEITSLDNKRIIIPNSSVWTGVTKNLTTNHTRRNDLEVTITPNNDIDQALRLIRQIVEAEPLILKQPAPIIGIAQQNETGVKVICQVWSAVADMISVKLAVYQAILAAFARAGITVPPQAPRPPAQPPS
jgi:small conductance mechanosensitive channel